MKTTKRNKVQKVYTNEAGFTFFGKGAKAARKLDGRIIDYNAMCQRSQTNGKEFKQPGSMK